MQLKEEEGFNGEECKGWWNKRQLEAVEEETQLKKKHNGALE